VLDLVLTLTVLPVTSVDMRLYRYFVLCLSLVRVDQTPTIARKKLV